MSEPRIVVRGVKRSELLTVLDRPKMLYLAKDTDGEPYIVVDYDGIVDGILAIVGVEVCDE